MKKLMLSLTLIGLFSCSSDNVSAELNDKISENENAQAKETFNKEDFFKSAIFFRGNIIDNSSSTLLISYKENLESRYKGDMEKYDEYINLMCEKLLIKQPNLYDDFLSIIKSKDFFESKIFYKNLSETMQTIFLKLQNFLK